MLRVKRSGQPEPRRRRVVVDLQRVAEHLLRRGVRIEVALVACQVEERPAELGAVEHAPRCGIDARLPELHRGRGFELGPGRLVDDVRLRGGRDGFGGRVG